MLAPEARLRRREDFTATVRDGRRAGRGGVVVHLVTPAAVPSAETDVHTNPVRDDGQVPSSRTGFVVSKAVGGAVVRNKVRRRLRHAVRELGSALPAGTDLVVRAQPSAAARTYQELQSDLQQAVIAATAARPKQRR